MGGSGYAAASADGMITLTWGKPSPLIIDKGDGLAHYSLGVYDPEPTVPESPRDVAALFAKSAGGVVAGEPVTREEFDELKMSHDLIDNNLTEVLKWIDGLGWPSRLESARAGEGVRAFFDKRLSDCRIEIGLHGEVRISGWDNDRLGGKPVAHPAPEV